MKNGSPAYLAARFVPAVFDGGNPGITVMFENITAQRQAEVALMENERFLFNILQLSPTPKFLIDKNHKVIFWNRALEIMTRLKAEEMMGTTLQWKAFYPGPRPASQISCSMAMQPGQDSNRELSAESPGIQKIPVNQRNSSRPLALAANGCTAPQRSSVTPTGT